jgi:hypothetical protein
MVLHILIRGQGDRVYSGRDVTNFHYYGVWPENTQKKVR